jgi:hypothetical protein
MSEQLEKEIDLDKIRAEFEQIVHGDANLARSPSGDYLALETTFKWRGFMLARCVAQPSMNDMQVLCSKAYAYDEWQIKTEWVQEQISSFPITSLGRHRADVMRAEIERLRKKPQKNAIASLNASLGIGQRKARPSPAAKRQEIRSGQVEALERALADIRRRACETPTWAPAYHSAATAVELIIADIGAGHALTAKEKA